MPLNTSPDPNTAHPPHDRATMVQGYVLAGGQSSRMGTDKASLPFAAATLLDHAIAALHLFCSNVTVVGPASTALSGCRAIPDHVTHTGPVAGVEAALTDLLDNGGTWAFFLPVDVPLLPGELLRVLADRWLRNPLTRVAFPTVDSRSQPVISLVHVAALPAMQRALALDQRRLRPALEDAAAQLADELATSRTHVLQTPALTLRDGTVWADGFPLPWQPSPDQLRLASLWFSNANTPAELDTLRQAHADANL